MVWNLKLNTMCVWDQRVLDVFIIRCTGSLKSKDRVLDIVQWNIFPILHLELSDWMKMNSLSELFKVRANIGCSIEQCPRVSDSFIDKACIAPIHFPNWSSIFKRKFLNSLSCFLISLYNRIKDVQSLSLFEASMDIEKGILELFNVELILLLFEKCCRVTK